jgi:plasmid stabilization system protein ParE
MIYRLRITDEASGNLRYYATWYAQTSQSLEIAAAWYDGFLATLDLLCSNPSRGALAPESEAFDFELREVHYGGGKRLSHRALYRIVGDTIEVLSIRHHAQRALAPGEI